MSAFCILYCLFSFVFVLHTVASTSKQNAHHLTWNIFFKGFLSFSPTQLRKKKQALTWKRGWNKLLWILQSCKQKRKKIIHQSICDHVVNKMFIGCKDMVKYCSFYSLLLWGSASWFDNKKRAALSLKWIKIKLWTMIWINEAVSFLLCLFGCYFDACLVILSQIIFNTKTCAYWISAINYSWCSTEKCETSELFLCNPIVLEIHLLNIFQDNLR